MKKSIVLVAMLSVTSVTVSAQSKSNEVKGEPLKESPVLVQKKSNTSIKRIEGMKPISVNIESQKAVPAKREEIEKKKKTKQK